MLISAKIPFARPFKSFLTEDCTTEIYSKAAMRGMTHLRPRFLPQQKKQAHYSTTGTIASSASGMMMESRANGLEAEMG